MANVLQFVIPFAVALWTARLATTRGRNPWVWGGAVLLLGIIPTDKAALLGMVPVVVLMFMKGPAAANRERPVRLACARCAQTHGPEQRYCTNCGWDLAEIYTPDLADAPQTTATPGHTSPVDQTLQPAAPAETAQPAESSPHFPNHDHASTTETPDTTHVGDEATAPEAPEPEAAPAFPDHLWAVPDPGVAPTAAVMTNRGLDRLRDGRIQEAIDQFTKAIALDPDYREAWEHRAAAYSKLGKDHEAEQDLRRVQGLNPGSTPS